MKSDSDGYRTYEELKTKVQILKKYFILQCLFTFLVLCLIGISCTIIFLTFNNLQNFLILLFSIVSISCLIISVLFCVFIGKAYFDLRYCYLINIQMVKIAKSMYNDIKYYLSKDVFPEYNENNEDDDDGSSILS